MVVGNGSRHRLENDCGRRCTIVRIATGAQQHHERQNLDKVVPRGHLHQ